MNTCSVSNTLCYGIAFTERNSTCSLLINSTSTTEDNLTPDPNTDIALVTNPTSQLARLDTSCPFANESIQTTSSGLAFSINCYTDFTPYTHYCPWDTAASRDGEKWCVPHTASLADCMGLCAEAHPLCTAVTWNPDLGNGFGNCYLKDFAIGNASRVTGEHSRYIVHAAVAELPDLDNGEGEVGGCPAQLNYSSSGASATDPRAEFELRCYESRRGTGNLTMLHMGSVEDCMDRCASYVDSSEECMGVVFDSSMLGGYENCFLLSALGETSGNVNSTFAQVVSRSNANGGGGGGGSSSKAWIAGPVIGGVAGVVILGVAAWWWRRQRQRQQSKDLQVMSESPASFGPDSESKPAIFSSGMQPSGPRFVEVEARPPQYELEAPSSQPRPELPAA
ncbi:hypothetical protein BJY01DRAFT_21033 [Aspergillus pseudoustus]|uniref:Apple domain-containing protein n=1 Tax=Aspergillus pseudoustus TaxID=1810923 RepID=A0ABR4JJR7_9EURO